jgi:Dolichyl-phosphate-mannose-protein mannosyltransferase
LPSGKARLRDSLLTIFVVALVLRLIVVAFLYPAQLNPRRDYWHFGYETGRIARAIASGRGFSDPLFGQTGPTAWMAPIYPYLVAGVFKLSGIYTVASAIILLSLNGLFSALTCLPVFFMARKSFGTRVGRWAAWAWALFPYAVFLSADAVWETCLTTLLLSLLFLATLYLKDSTRLVSWGGAGLLCGFSALVDPAVIAVAPFLGGWACYRLHGQGRRWVFPATVGGLVMVAAVTPWFIRNYRTFHQFVPFRDNFGLELHVGNNGDTSHWVIDWAHPSVSQAEMAEYRRMGEPGYMAAKRQEAVAFIAGHLRWFAWLTLRRIVFTWTGFWSFDRAYLHEEPFDPVNIPVCTTLTLLALLGLWRAFRLRTQFAVPYALLLLSFPVVFYITHCELRYRHRMDPYLVVLATYAVLEWFAWRPARSMAGAPSD